MTVKEIALSVNKTERSVRNWVKKIAEKSSVIAEKSSASNPTYPADYTLNETIEIIKIGLGKNAANIFRMNAEKTEKKSEISRVENLENLMIVFMQQQAETNKAILKLVNQSNSNQKQIELKQDYFSILAYCNKNDIRLSFSEAIKYGKEAKRISNEIEKEVRKIPDERFGQVNSYSIEVLKKVFEV